MGTACVHSTYAHVRVRVYFFFFRLYTLAQLSRLPTSDFENFDDNFDDNFDLIDDTPPGLFPPDSGSVPNGDDEDDNGLGIQYMPKPPLRSRPPIDFSTRRSTVDTDLDFSAAAAFPPPCSHMSGSTLRSSLHPSTAPSFSRKTSLERELVEFRTAKSESLGSDIYQAVPHSVNSCRADSRGADSHASSLGPSDSASQQTRTDVMKDKAIEDLLESVEPPPMRPEFLPKTVLWDFEDCETNNLAIRHPNGTKISNAELSNMRRSAEMIVQKLINFVNSDPHSACAGAPKAWTKTFIKKYFTAEHYRAVLDLEAEQKLLCLCSAHWKADAFITQVFLRRSKEKAMAAMNAAPATSPQSNLSLEPPTAFVPQIQEVAPMNLTKRALELSPGPKSPSASHTQKCNKDNHVPAVSGQKTIGSRGPLNQNQHPAARKITPTFLNRTKMTCAEPAPTSLHLLHIDPLVDNLVATLTSEFPSLTNTPCLLYSMSAQSSFKEGKPSEQVTTLLERVQFADPCSPDIDEDNMCQGWGHYQFMAGGISPASSLTSWEKVGSVATAFKLVAAAIKMCQEARSMCSNARMPKTSGFISDAYLEKILKCLESCWVGAGRVFTSSQNRVPLPTTPSYRDVAMSPPPRGPVIRIKRPALPTDVATSKIPEVPTGTDSTTQPPATTEPTEPSVGLDEGAQASATSLKLLQVSELLAWFGDNKLSAPKWKRKDDLVDAIVKSPELAHISELTIKEIIKKRKAKKGPPKPLTA
ncbi:hypothetical protein H4582DRAFT_2069590 [Lactarius indigo]|nr:hypothetical protein H4582DRAFT_2069590 [Lactarius indigo]